MAGQHPAGAPAALHQALVAHPQVRAVLHPARALAALRLAQVHRALARRVLAALAHHQGVQI